MTEPNPRPCPISEALDRYREATERVRSSTSTREFNEASAELFNARKALDTLRKGELP